MKISLPKKYKKVNTGPIKKTDLPYLVNAPAKTRKTKS